MRADKHRIAGWPLSKSMNAGFPGPKLVAILGLLELSLGNVEKLISTFIDYTVFSHLYNIKKGGNHATSFSIKALECRLFS